MSAEVNFIQYIKNNYTEKIERLNADDSLELHEAFNLFDTANDGKISASQIGDVVRSLGQNPTNAEIEKCTNGIDANERISFDTFIPILQSLVKSSGMRKYQDANKSSVSIISPGVSPDKSKDIDGNGQVSLAEEFISGLQNFDCEGNGTINSSELRHLLVTLGEPLTEDDVEVLLNGQEDEEGNVNYENLVKMVLEG